MAQLRHLALRCGDIDRSRTFYQTVFGWEFLGYRGSGRSLDLTDGVLNVTLIDQPSTGGAESQRQTGSRRIRPCVPYQSLGPRRRCRR